MQPNWQNSFWEKEMLREIRGDLVWPIALPWIPCGDRPRRTKLALVRVPIILQQLKMTYVNGWEMESLGSTLQGLVYNF